MSLKRSIQMAIRQIHKFAAYREVPEKLGLYFHELEEAQYPIFSDCIRYWTELGYEFVNADEFVDRNDGKILFISFDDNFKSWHTALPLFESLGAKVTFYVNTLPIRGKADADAINGFFDRIRHTGERVTLSEDEIREISSAGHTIGCHSHSHFDLGAVPEEKAKSEIMISKEILEDIVQRPITDFSYPFGMRRNFTDGLRDFCLENGFRTVCNAIPGRLHEAPTARFINRSPWDLSQSLSYNIENIRIDGRMFEQMTGRSAVV